MQRTRPSQHPATETARRPSPRAGAPGRLPAGSGRFAGALALAAVAAAPWVASRVSADAAAGEQARTSDAEVARAVSRAYQDVSARIAASVVQIATFVAVDQAFGSAARGRAPAEEGAVLPLGQGSGVVYDASGLIVTNAHVVGGASRLQVTLQSGEVLDATLVGSDVESDLALLRVPATGLTAAEFRVDPPARVGESVLAVGNPLGLGHTVTSGIISGVGRSGLAVATYEDFLQTDAAINPGNSGGPLVDLEGRVVGINTAVADARRGGQGIGFAIPAWMVADVAKALAADGGVTRGYLGVQLDMLPTGVAGRDSGQWVGVTYVYPGSPAAKAGLRQGDYILGVAGESVESVQELLALVADIHPGTEVPLRMRRAGEDRVVPITVGARPAPRGR